MINYTVPEKLAAILLVETAKNADFDDAGMKNALRLAMEYANMEYANIGVCRTVLRVLEYPDTERAL